MKLYFGSKGGIYYNKRGKRNYLNHDQKRLLFGTITPTPPSKNAPRRGTYHGRRARIIEGRDDRFNKLQNNLQNRRGNPPLIIDTNLGKVATPPGFTPKSSTRSDSTQLTLSSPRIINEKNLIQYIQKAELLGTYLREFYLKINNMGIKDYRQITVDNIVRAFILIDEQTKKKLPNQIDTNFDYIFEGVVFDTDEQIDQTKIVLLYILDELYEFRSTQSFNNYCNELKQLYKNTGLFF